MASAPVRPVIGRPEMLAAFRDRRDSVERGHGAVTILEGEAGVGKSTFLSFFLQESRKRGDRVLAGHARPGVEAPPFQLIREALGIDLPSPGIGGEGAEEPSASSGERLAEMLRSLGDSTDPGRARSFGPLTEAFLGLARGAPTIVAFENLDDVDPGSLEFLTHLAPSVVDHRLWIILTSPPAGGLHEAARQFIETLPRAASTDRFVLRPLAPGELGEFVHWVDPSRPARPQELNLWYTETGGNPLFLEQVVRAARRSTPSLWEQASASGLPFTEFVHARLREIPDEERRVLSLGAVIGREFSFPLLLSATGVEEERLAELVERLVERGLLREVPPDLLEFSRDDLRELVYADMTETLRRLLHQRVTEAIEATGRHDPDTVFALAHHAYFGRIEPVALEYNRRAAEFAARVASPEIARTHLERALECLRRMEPVERVGELEIVLELALALDRVGELERAEATLRDALARGPPAAAPAGVAAELLPVYLARILTDQGRWDEARRLTDQLLDHVDEMAAPASRLALHRLRGEIEYYRGSYAESVRYQNLALEAAQKLGDLREVALVRVRRANALAMIPDCVDEAIPAYREATAELLRLGDPAEAAYSQLFLGITLAQNGRTPEGLVELESAAVLAEESSDLRQLGWALFNIADLRREVQELEVARRQNARSREILTRIGDQFGLAQTHIIAGKIGIATGELDDAERELLEAFRLVRQLRTEPDELEVLLRLAEVAFGRGDVPLARARADELRRREVERLRPDLRADVRRLIGNVGSNGPATDGAVAA
ncbi:MAG TPA: AAA family ATPase [Thermoplasmata archaeon]|nr:AAA family ATPase [Thermoplasmata archaeon]